MKEMNREQRRMAQRQGLLDAEGKPIATPRESRPAATARERVTPRQYASEVRSEMRRVSWPTRSEVLNYTLVVLATLLIATALVAGLDYLFGEAIIQLLRAGS
jgi:preprotein translocase subunit SecE